MKKESKSKQPGKLPEEIPVTTGTFNTTHNSHSIDAGTSSHINSGGDSIHGRHTDTGSELQGRQVAHEQDEFRRHRKK